MPQPDLKGKTVMLAPTDKIFARFIKKDLEDLGATVVFSSRPPSNSSFIPLIVEGVEKHVPKIDALIIQNNTNNVEIPEVQVVALELAKRFKDSCPVIVCDNRAKHADIKSLKDARAKYFNPSEMEGNQIAFAVSDAIAQRGKPGRKVGG